MLSIVRTVLAWLTMIVGTNAAGPTVVIDLWWSFDFAKGSCERSKQWYETNKKLINELGCNAVTACSQSLPLLAACTTDPEQEKERYFFDQLATRFASNTQCRGVRVFRFYGHNSKADSSPEEADALANPHSTLIVDYVEGLPKQGWTLVGSPYTVGEGDAKQMADDVCAIVTVNGAKFPGR